MPARGKPPATKRALMSWLSTAAREIEIPQRRLSVLVANSVVLAALQRDLDASGPRFLLKGGTGIEFRLGLRARASADLDTLFRGEFQHWLESLDRALAEPFPPFTFSRSEPELIEVSTRVVKPYRVRIQLFLNGSATLSTQLEVAPDEAGAGNLMENLTLPNLAYFGIEVGVSAAAMLLNYQVVQKFHAVTDPHDPPNYINDRAHDLVDLLLLRRAFYLPSNSDQLYELRSVAVDLFRARARDADLLGLSPRKWPPSIHLPDHWREAYRAACEGVGQGSDELPRQAQEAANEVVEWITEIDRVSTR